MFLSFKQRLKQYLSFSKKDRNAIVILSILIIIVLLANIMIDLFEVKSDYDYSEFELALNEWENSQTNISDNKQYLFDFNPNTISKERLDTLLLTDFIKNNLLNYRKAGGEIKSVEDFRKIYGMNDSIFNEIKEYVKVPVHSIDEIKKSTKKISKEIPNTPLEIEPNIEFSKTENLPIIIELNSADSVDLIKLKGIGPVFASRILKYRNLLGGYYSKYQLQEVYNLSEETFLKIQDNLTTDTMQIKPIRINFADYRELLRHPYLNKEQVEAILDYREANGTFSNKNQIYSFNLVDSFTFNRIKSYISCR